MNEDFCRQTRRFSAAILTDCKGKQRRVLAKRPFRRCAMIMKTASQSASVSTTSSAPSLTEMEMLSDPGAYSLLTPSG